MKKLAVILCLFLNAQCSDQSRRALEGFGGQTNDQATLGAVVDLSAFNLDFEGWEESDCLGPIFVAEQSQSQSINQGPLAPAAAAAAVEEEYKPVSSNQHSKKQTAEERREKHRIAQVILNLQPVIKKHSNINKYFEDYMQNRGRNRRPYKSDQKGLELYKIGEFIGNNINGNNERVLYNQFLLVLDQYIYQHNAVPSGPEMKKLLDQLRFLEQKREEEQYHSRKRSDRKRWQEEGDEE